eukprot:CAMPEP_0119300124 /NCGR_PEP_ID=MMETSP1333-20130426/2124_1 /TAXON_ID=418940 /ORGANISM="Scyphosphaera apsteinii, Strain RCC1455" /LENGTH=1172 /DNA_ID=CAMNT_0007301789 /DNA_START=49 /DNA_END=3567 /DNA_ORIENTATION=-
MTMPTSNPIMAASNMTMPTSDSSMAAFLGALSSGAFCEMESYQNAFWQEFNSGVVNSWAYPMNLSATTFKQAVGCLCSLDMSQYALVLQSLESGQVQLIVDSILNLLDVIFSADNGICKSGVCESAITGLLTWLLQLGDVFFKDPDVMFGASATGISLKLTDDIPKLRNCLCSGVSFPAIKASLSGFGAVIAPVNEQFDMSALFGLLKKAIPTILGSQGPFCSSACSDLFGSVMYSTIELLYVFLDLNRHALGYPPQYLERMPKLAMPASALVGMQDSMSCICGQHWDWTGFLDMAQGVVAWAMSSSTFSLKSLWDSVKGIVPKIMGPTGFCAGTCTSAINQVVGLFTEIAFHAVAPTYIGLINKNDPPDASKIIPPTALMGALSTSAKNMGNCLCGNIDWSGFVSLTDPLIIFLDPITSGSRQFTFDTATITVLTTTAKNYITYFLSSTGLCGSSCVQVFDPLLSVESVIIGYANEIFKTYGNVLYETSQVTSVARTMRQSGMAVNVEEMLYIPTTPGAVSTLTVWNAMKDCACAGSAGLDWDTLFNKVAAALDYLRVSSPETIVNAIFAIIKDLVPFVFSAKGMCGNKCSTAIMTGIRYVLDPAMINALIRRSMDGATLITVPSTLGDNVAALTLCACGMNWAYLINFIERSVATLMASSQPVIDQAFLKSVVDVVVRDDMVCSPACYTALAGLLVDIATMVPNVVPPDLQNSNGFDIGLFFPSATEMTASAESGCLCSAKANFQPIYDFFLSLTGGTPDPGMAITQIKSTILDPLTTCSAPPSPPSTYTVTKATFPGTPETFDIAAYEAKLAAHLGVPKSNLSTSVKAASVVVTTVLETSSVFTTAKVTQKLIALSASPEVASEVLGMPVEAIEAPAVLTKAQAIADKDVDHLPGHKRENEDERENEDDDGSEPCFASSVSVCRLSSVAVAPEEAYQACFSTGTAAAGRVLMSEVQAGDVILSSKHEASRVIVNQHRAKFASSEVLTIVHERGSIALTPDHVLFVDGEFVASRHAVPGSILSSGVKVMAVQRGVDGVINPLTTSGKVLAASHGEPVVASTYPEWIARYMLDVTLTPLPISFSNVLSLVFPAHTQAFYDALVEPIFPASSGSYRSYLEAVPAALVPLAVFAGDVIVSFSFGAYMLAAARMLAAAIAVAAVGAAVTQACKA